MTAQNLTDNKARAQKAYLANRVQGADPQELLVMLYQGLQQGVRAGKIALENKIWDDAHAELAKARRIVTYLTNSLRPEGGEITERLRQLYGFCFENIGRASLEQDPTLLDGVLKVVQELTGAWSELAKGEPMSLPTGVPEEDGKS